MLSPETQKANKELVPHFLYRWQCRDGKGVVVFITCACCLHLNLEEIVV